MTSTSLYKFQATHVHPSCRNFIPIVTKEGLVNETPFLDKLNVREGAKIMIIHNIDISDGLTNGTTGTVVGFIKNDGELAENPSDVNKILIKFDDMYIGE